MDIFGIMGLKEFADLIKTPESTIRTWKRRQDIPERCFKKVGGTLFVKIKEMKEFFAI